MSLFKRIFSAKETTKKDEASATASKWLKLNNIEQVDILKKISEEKLVVIFKHSTRCGISSMVWNRFQNNEYLAREDVHFFYLDLLSYRDISTAIAQEFQVLHQSPQLLILKNNEVVHHSSHSAVNASVLANFLD
ncbi:MAG: bacillithiol system redox-active protein YtxJ [Flavobacteriaceae bacterium]|nr:bacillithiol system redox-active protein YtxJ [Flavobacteriaceae bacterium]